MLLLSDFGREKGPPGEPGGTPTRCGDPACGICPANPDRYQLIRFNEAGAGWVQSFPNGDSRGQHARRSGVPRTPKGICPTGAAFGTSSLPIRLRARRVSRRSVMCSFGKTCSRRFSRRTHSCCERSQAMTSTLLAPVAAARSRISGQCAEFTHRQIIQCGSVFGGHRQIQLIVPADALHREDARHGTDLCGDRRHRIAPAVQPRIADDRESGRIRGDPGQSGIGEPLPPSCRRRGVHAERGPDPGPGRARIDLQRVHQVQIMLTESAAAAAESGMSPFEMAISSDFAIFSAMGVMVALRHASTL